MPPKNFYAVRRGVAPGLYTDWESAKLQVNGFTGAEFKGFETQHEAESYLKKTTRFKALPLGHTSQPPTPAAPPPRQKSPLRISQSRLPVILRNPIEQLDLTEIYVDGGHNRQTGVEAWGCVVDAGGRDLIAPHADLFQDIQLRDVILPVGPRYVFVALFTDVKSQQNNGAELLAMVGGLRLALKYPQVQVVKSDSEVMVTWWSRCLAASKRPLMDPRKLKFIDEMILLRKAFEARGGRLQKISGDDNLSDLGFHVRKR